MNIPGIATMCQYHHHHHHHHQSHHFTSKTTTCVLSSHTHAVKSSPQRCRLNNVHITHSILQSMSTNWRHANDKVTHYSRALRPITSWAHMCYSHCDRSQNISTVLHNKLFASLVNFEWQQDRLQTSLSQITVQHWHTPLWKLKSLHRTMRFICTRDFDKLPTFLE